ncbi:MAG: VanZ family protein [Anaeroplasma bactoclasticum]|nr:VanZ family protein [Anaeroplasma bactoclasticum]
MGKKMGLISKISFLVWSICLVTVITFATKQAKQVFNALMKIVPLKTIKVEDVDMNIPAYYVIGREYELRYTVYPQTTEDAGLKFESLNPDVFKVNGNSKIVGLRTEEENTSGQLRITSSGNPDFEKIVDLEFKKTYPADLTFEIYKWKTTYDEETKAYDWQKDVPIYLTYQLIAGRDAISEAGVTFTYDEEYIEKVNNYKFIPRKETGDEPTKITCTASNGKSVTLNFNITPHTEVEAISAFSLVDANNNPMSIDEPLLVGSNPKVYLKNGDDFVYTDYILSSSDESVLGVTSSDNLVIKKAGKAVLTVTVPHPEKEVTYAKEIIVKNQLNLPVLSGDVIQEDGTIVLKYDTRAKITYSYPWNTTYRRMSIQCGSIGLSATDPNDVNYFYMRGLKIGDTTMTITINDGFQELKQVYKVKVIREKVDGLSTSALSRIVSKYLGHMLFFMIDGFLACWAFFIHSTKKRRIRGILALLTSGLYLACLTEFIQYFIPGRNCCVEDVVLDTTGYFIGAAIFLILWMIKTILFKGIQLAKNGKKKQPTLE